MNTEPKPKLSLENRVINNLCTKVGTLEGNLAYVSEENRELRETVQSLTEELEEYRSNSNTPNT